MTMGNPTAITTGVRVDNVCEFRAVGGCESAPARARIVVFAGHEMGETLNTVNEEVLFNDQYWARDIDGLAAGSDFLNRHH